MARELLREFIRSVLVEKAVTTAEAKSLALWVFEGDTIIVIAYDSQVAMGAIKQAKANGGDAKDVLQQAMRGYLQLNKPEQPCWDALIVSNSAAEKGFGPLMYDIGFSLAHDHTLVSDRKSVSDKAKGIWQQMKDRKSSAHTPVDVKMLDNVDDPITDEPNDDCKVHPTDDFDESPLNFAYTAKQPIDVSQFRQRHEEFLDWGEQNGIERDSLANAIENAGNDFFSGKYWG